MKFAETLIFSLCGQTGLDKWHGVDEAQVNNLPEELRIVIIHGPDKEAQEAIDNLQANPKTAVGEAALELLNDLRQFAAQNETS